MLISECLSIVPARVKSLALSHLGHTPPASRAPHRSAALPRSTMGPWREGGRGEDEVGAPLVCPGSEGPKLKFCSTMAVCIQSKNTVTVSSASQIDQEGGSLTGAISSSSSSSSSSSPPLSGFSPPLLLAVDAACIVFTAEKSKCKARSHSSSVLHVTVRSRASVSCRDCTSDCERAPPLLLLLLGRRRASNEFCTSDSSRPSRLTQDSKRGRSARSRNISSRTTPRSASAGCGRCTSSVMRAPISRPSKRNSNERPGPRNCRHWSSVPCIRPSSSQANFTIRLTAVMAGARAHGVERTPTVASHCNSAVRRAYRSSVFSSSQCKSTHTATPEHANKCVNTHEDDCSTARSFGSWLGVPTSSCGADAGAASGRCCKPSNTFTSAAPARVCVSADVDVYSAVLAASMVAHPAAAHGSSTAT